MINKILISTLVLMLLVSVSCTSTSVRLEEQNRSLAEIKNAILAISGKPRILSENQREITTQYFGRDKGTQFDPQSSPERLYTRFVILGERRPYEITVEVFVEKKIEGVFENTGEDEAVSKQVASELYRKLNQGREDRNIIDDFRPF